MTTSHPLWLRRAETRLGWAGVIDVVFEHPKVLFTPEPL